MFGNYLKVAIRNLLKHKSYAAINTLSLAFGLAISLTALSYVIHELSWEDSHVNRERIYRVEARYEHVDTVENYARVMPPLGRTLVDEIPEVEQAAVLTHTRRVALEVGEKEYELDALIFAPPEFFEVFSVEFQTGNPRVSLSEPNCAVISASAAEQYFPGVNPLGQIVEFNHQDTCRITGVFADLPNNTQLKTEFIASYSTLAARGAELNSWRRENFFALTYLLLRDGVEPLSVAEKISPLVGRFLPAEMAERFAFRLKPLNDIYFSTYFSGNTGEIYPGGEWEIVYMFIAIALFILIQAIANFINLATARSSERMKEVGIRKTFGADRPQLIRQFLGESIIITGVAMIIGLNLFEFFRRGIQTVLPRQGTVDLYSEPLMMLSCVVLTLLVGVLAGAYPALYLSRFRPVAVFQTKAGLASSRSWLRKSLVVFQFTLAIIFALSTVIIYRQMTFVTGMDLGFNHEKVLILNFNGEDAADNCALLKNQLQTGNVAADITAAGHALGTASSSSWGYFTNPRRSDEDRVIVKSYAVDYNFLSFYGLKLTQGRGFTPEIPEDIGHGIIINEAMVAELGLDNPVGHRLYTRDSFREVVGVVQDFIGTTMNYSYRTMTVLRLDPGDCDVLALRLPAEDLTGSVARIRETWHRALPNTDFTYSFLSDDIRSGYAEMDDMINVFGVLALVSLGIACLGIFGLVSYTAARKTREIGIRKVLGASVFRIVSLLGREFAVLIIIANVIAAPLAYFWISTYLQEFPFRVSLGLGTFAAGGILALIIALGTAGWHSFKAALANPVDSLRHE